MLVVTSGDNSRTCSVQLCWVMCMFEHIHTHICSIIYTHVEVYMNDIHIYKLLFSLCDLHVFSSKYHELVSNVSVYSLGHVSVYSLMCHLGDVMYASFNCFYTIIYAEYFRARTPNINIIPHYFIIIITIIIFIVVIIVVTITITYCYYHYH